MKNNTSISLTFPVSASGIPAPCLPISQEVAEKLFTADELAKGEARLDVETRGPCGMVSKVAGLAVSKRQDRAKVSPHCPTYAPTDCVIHGRRTLLGAKPSGYDMEGMVSLAGKKHRAFTSTVMFELPGGKLVNAAVLYVCE